jgi:hypothetical protein
MLDLPCIYRGEHVVNHLIDGKMTPTYQCACEGVAPQRCTIEVASKQHAFCPNCDSRIEKRVAEAIQYEPNHWQYVTTDRLIRGALSLAPHVPAKCAGIVGIPRSGMMCAAALAASLHLPLFELSPHNDLRQIGKGTRCWWEDGSRKDGTYFVIDDSVYGGDSISMARASMVHPAVFAAAIVTPEKAHLVDCYAEQLASPHLFEWNFFNNAIIEGRSIDPRLRGGVAFDFDGVLCEDPPVLDADGGSQLEEYGRWIDNARPKHLPRYCSIPLIVTFRLERWRERTDAWLRRYGVQCDALVMSPYETASERNANFNAGEHKGKAVLGYECSMMVESDPRQALVIHQATQRPVLCPDEGRVYQDHTDFKALLELNRLGFR